MISCTARRFLMLLCLLLIAACAAPADQAGSAATDAPAAQQAPLPEATPVSASALSCPDAPAAISGPIVFINENNLLALREDGGTAQQVTSTPLDVYTHEPFWSPDGQTLTFIWTLFGANPQNIQETTAQVQLICGIDRSTGKGRVLLRRENTREFFDAASWTPDGSDLIVTVVPLTGDSNLAHLARLDLTTGTTQLLRDTARNGVLAPDQSQLAYLQLLPQTEGFSMTLMLAQADGSQERPAVNVEPPFTYMSAASWSADGKRLLFTGAGGPISKPPQTADTRSWFDYLFGVSVARAHSIDADLWIMDADGQNLRQLTSGLDDPRSTWSPDGRQIAYTGNKKGGVFILDIESGSTRKISDLGLSSGIAWARP
jgi:Tol biopolymer transport system component